MQVTIIGGGSYQWTPELLADLFGMGSLKGLRVVLEDIDPRPLAKMAGLGERLSEALGAGATVDTTTDQPRALEGADFVVVTVSTGGFASMSWISRFRPLTGSANRSGIRLGRVVSRGRCGTSRYCCRSRRT